MPSARALRVIILAKVSSSPPIASATTTAASFADLVTSARIASSTAERLARPQPELGGRLLRGVVGDLHLGIEAQLAGLDLLEQQIERHDLGERSRDDAARRHSPHAARCPNWHRPPAPHRAGCRPGRVKRLRRPRASAGSVMIAVSAIVVASRKSPKRRPSAGRIARSIRLPRPDAGRASPGTSLLPGVFDITPRCLVANALRGLCKTPGRLRHRPATVWETFLPKG